MALTCQKRGYIASPQDCHVEPVDSLAINGNIVRSTLQLKNDMHHPPTRE
jgi:hypothetical protein